MKFCGPQSQVRPAPRLRWRWTCLCPHMSNTRNNSKTRLSLKRRKSTNRLRKPNRVDLSQARARISQLTKKTSWIQARLAHNPCLGSKTAQLRRVELRQNRTPSNLSSLHLPTAHQVLSLEAVVVAHKKEFWSPVTISSLSMSSASWTRSKTWMTMIWKVLGRTKSRNLSRITYGTRKTLWQMTRSSMVNAIRLHTGFVCRAVLMKCRSAVAVLSSTSIRKKASSTSSRPASKIVFKRSPPSLRNSVRSNLKIYWEPQPRTLPKKSWVVWFHLKEVSAF